ncbi:hypothetical protein CFN78_01165 [Amycolatopsis antarctica]|uniref:Uncharacterized protein n=1 Tax=Amycolatopsis antarctica TaxID=1854586 RepID=A0A263DBT3_9PSEU|nr:hypothetical protein [Amycolatopsis antarctica]OZM74855.1 hypothetical protein CFN78_01165 [Amycolatopsis antarctica]
MNDTEWLPSRIRPDHLHTPGHAGTALCGVELNQSTSRCALCSLESHRRRRNHPQPELRQRIERQCDHPEQPIPARLRCLSTDVDADHATAADALDPLCGLLVDTYIETESAAHLLRGDTSSVKARLAGEHLVDTLMALENALTGHSGADAALRFG